MQRGPRPQAAESEEIGLEIAAPEPPDIVLADIIAKREWYEITALLLQMGIVAETDKSLITAYCLAWSEFITAHENIKGEYVVRGPAGGAVYNPWWCIRNNAEKRIRQLAGDLGIGPVSRARLHLGVASDD